MSKRIQKYLANLGVASRREIERWIEAGEITVDGKLCTIGQTVTGEEKIFVRGEQIRCIKNTNPRMLVYHKPEGEIVTRSDPQQRPTVFENLPKLVTGRWIAVGRLDINTSGLLLFTTDGELANNLMHPRNQIEREYRMRVLGEITNEILSRLQQGVKLDDGFAKLKIIEVQESKGANTWCRVMIKEGRNREVRRLWESQGLKVSRLIRIRYANIELPRNLKAGHYSELALSKVNQLRKITRSDSK